MQRTISFMLNGKPTVFDGEDERALLWVLRYDLGLTGAKYGCGEGLCGACTVVVDNQAVRACVTTLRDVEGKSVLTIEGLEQAGKLHPLQQAFLRHHAFQCGYCTPGMMMTARALLARTKAPSEAEIRNAISGNLCRCTGYVNIVKAVQHAAQTAR